MKGLILLFYTFSAGIFFCTLALFSASYTGGGTTYAVYSFALAAVIGLTLFLSVIKMLATRNLGMKKVTLFLITMLLSLLISTVYGYFFYGTEPSTRILQYFLAFTAPSFVVALLVKEEDVERFYKLLKYLNFYLSLCILVAFMQTGGAGQFESIGGTTYLLIGYTMAALFPYNFISFVNEKVVLKKLLYVALMVFYISMIFISGSRGAMISIIVTFVIMFYQYIVKGRKVIRYTTTLAAVVYIVILVLNSNAQYNIAWLRMSMLFESDFGMSSSGRDIFYEKAWAQFYENPMFGNGIGAYANSFGEYVYPHNIVLEILNDFGVVGFTIAFIIMIFVFSNARRMMKSAVHNQYIVLLLVQAITMLMFSGSYLTAIQFWIPLILILTISNRIKVVQTKESAILQRAS